MPGWPSSSGRRARGEQRLDAGVDDHELQTVDRVRRVERHVGGTEVERGEDADEHVDAPGHRDPDAVVAPDAGGGEAAAEFGRGRPRAGRT